MSDDRFLTTRCSLWKALGELVDTGATASLSGICLMPGYSPTKQDTYIDVSNGRIAVRIVFPGSQVLRNPVWVNPRVFKSFKASTFVYLYKDHIVVEGTRIELRQEQALDNQHAILCGLYDQVPDERKALPALGFSNIDGFGKLFTVLPKLGVRCGTLYTAALSDVLHGYCDDGYVDVPAKCDLYTVEFLGMHCVTDRISRLQEKKRQKLLEPCDGPVFRRVLPKIEQVHE